MAAIKFIKRTVALDGNSISEQLPASFFNNEASAHTFIIAAMRGGEPLMLSGAVSGVFLNPNDAAIPLSGSIVDGAAVLTLSDNCYALSGRFTLTIDVAGATVYECNSRIKRRSSGTAYDPDDELSVATLSQVIAEMRSVMAGLDDYVENAENAIVGKGQDVLASIPSDYTALTDKVAMISESTANLIIPEYAIADAVINSSGVVISMAATYGYVLHVAPVTSGQKYTFLTNDASRLYGFFSTVPEMASTTYNNSRVTNIGSGALTITAPITGYIAFRSENHYATPMINAGDAAQPYEEPYTAKDTVAREKLEALDGLLTPGNALLYDGLKASDTFSPYAGPDFYSICTVTKGTKVISFSGIYGNSITAYLVFVYTNGGNYYIEKSLPLSAGNGSTFVDTPINYVPLHDCYLFCNEFGFAVSSTRSEIPLIATIGGGAVSNVRNGTRPLDYTCKITVETFAGGVADLLANDRMDSVLFRASCVSMIQTMGTCGDSYAAGMIGLTNPNRMLQDTNRSWGKVLGRNYGIDVSVYALGGVTTKNYLIESSCLPKLLSESAKELYAISLGHNDMYYTDSQGYTPQQIAAYVGSVSSLDGDWQHYPDTLIGNYGKIVEQIAAHAPRALIVLLRQTRPYASLSGGTEINNAISAIGQHYGLPVFDPELDPYLSSDVWISTMSRNHPLYTGYAGLAEAFARLFAYYTTVYPAYFGAFGTAE